MCWFSKRRWVSKEKYNSMERLYKEAYKSQQKLLEIRERENNKIQALESYKYWSVRLNKYSVDWVNLDEYELASLVKEKELKTFASKLCVVQVGTPYCGERCSAMSAHIIRDVSVYSGTTQIKVKFECAQKGFVPWEQLLPNQEKINSMRGALKC